MSAAPETPTTAPAPAAPKRIPFVTDFLRMVRVLFSPTEVFEEQREAPAFWVPWVIVTVLVLVMTWVNFPFTIKMTRLMYAARGQQLPQAAEGVMRIWGMAVAPVFLLLVLMATAALMYVVLMASGGEVRYKGLLSVVTITGLVGMLQLVATFVVFSLRGIEGMQTVADFQVSFGLDLLLPQDTSLPRFLEGMLRGVNPFSIWSLVLTAIGIQVTERTSKAAAWSAASLAFILGVALAGVGAIFSGGPR